METQHNLLVGTVCGTVASIAPELLNWSSLFLDILRTTLLAAFGATISFVVSLLLRQLLKKRKE